MTIEMDGETGKIKMNPEEIVAFARLAGATGSSESIYKRYVDYLQEARESLQAPIDPDAELVTVLDVSDVRRSR